MVKKIEVTNNGKSYNCYSGSMCYILKNYGTYLSEATSFGLSGGMGFILNRENKVSFSCVREEHCLTEHLIKLGIRVLEIPMADYVCVKNYIHMCIEEGKPVMLQYNGFYLNHTPIYKVKHDTRIGLVTGYEEGYYYITDFVYGVINYRVTENSFFKAIFNSKMCEKDMFNMFLVTYPININDKIIKVDVEKSIIECAEFFLYSKSSNTLLLGLDGIYKLNERLEENLSLMYNSSDWDKIYVDLKQAVIAIHNYAVFFYEIYYIGLSRFNDSQTDEIFNYFEDASKHWNIFCNFVYVYKMTSKVIYLKKINNTILEFYNSLNNGFNLIKNIYIN